MPKFVKVNKEDQADIDFSEWTDLEKWVYLLKNMHRWNEAPPIYRIGFFKKVLQVAEVSKLNVEEQKMYRTSLQDKHDYENSIVEASRTAAEIAEKRGEARGEAKEAERKNHEFVMSLLSANRFSDEEIASFAGVYLSYVQKVRAELENKTN